MKRVTRECNRRAADLGLDQGLVHRRHNRRRRYTEFGHVHMSMRATGLPERSALPQCVVGDGACITRNRTQSMSRSRGGLTSKIHAVVDTNGLPVRLALTAGEAHDNRLADRLLTRLKSGRVGSRRGSGFE